MRSHDIHRYYVDLHSRAREYRKLIQRLNSQKIKQGKKPRAGDRVEMNNFQELQVCDIRRLDSISSDILDFSSRVIAHWYVFVIASERLEAELGISGHEPCFLPVITIDRILPFYSFLILWIL